MTEFRYYQGIWTRKNDLNLTWKLGPLPDFCLKGSFKMTLNSIFSYWPRGEKTMLGPIQWYRWSAMDPPSGHVSDVSYGPPMWSEGHRAVGTPPQIWPWPSPHFWAFEYPLVLTFHWAKGSFIQSRGWKAKIPCLGNKFPLRDPAHVLLRVGGQRGLRLGELASLEH